MVVINEAIAEKRKRYKKVIPEGGYGYFVGLGYALPLIYILGTGTSRVIIFDDLLKAGGKEATVLSMVWGYFSVTVSLAGCFTNYLFKNYSKRTIGLTGSTLYCLGAFALIFIQTTDQLILFAGAVQGTGFGLIMIATLSTFNSYFTERRAFVFNIFQTLIGIGMMIFPIVIQQLMETYGMRGTVAVMAALSCHCLLGTALLHPVEWHMKIIEIKVPDETESLYNRGELLATDDKSSPIKDEKSKTVWQSVVTFFDLTLLKDIVYVNIALGQTFVFYADFGFQTLMPLYLLHIGFSTADASFCISVAATADLISRICLIGFFAFYKFPARYLLLIGIILTIVGRIALLAVTERLTIILIIAFIGFVKSWLLVLQPLVLAEHFSQERFPAAYGLYLFFMGVIIFALSPIAGIIRDKTDNFFLSIHSFTFFLAITVIAWTTEFIVCKCRRKNKHKNRQLTEIHL